MTVIQVDHLSKVFHVQHKEPGLRGAVKALFLPKYEDKVAVNGILFSVDTGEMIGYIGVNGAGKSTTIKMLTGILVPTSGSVRVLGRNPYRHRIMILAVRLHDHFFQRGMNVTSVLERRWILSIKSNGVHQRIESVL